MATLAEAAASVLSSPSVLELDVGVIEGRLTTERYEEETPTPINE